MGLEKEIRAITIPHCLSMRLERSGLKLIKGQISVLLGYKLAELFFIRNGGQLFVSLGELIVTLTREEILRYPCCRACYRNQTTSHGMQKRLYTLPHASFSELPKNTSFTYACKGERQIVNHLCGSARLVSLAYCLCHNAICQLET